MIAADTIIAIPMMTEATSTASAVFWSCSISLTMEKGAILVMIQNVAVNTPMPSAANAADDTSAGPR
jgi:hypothetical protein